MSLALMCSNRRIVIMLEISAYFAALQVTFLLRRNVALEAANHNEAS